MLPRLRIKNFFIPLLFFFLVRSSAVSGQCNLLCNTDFENVPYIPNVSVIPAPQVPCWQTTASDNKIEVWHNGYNGVPSYSGTYFIELNANLVSTLYQDFVTTPGTSVTVSFAHRGRAGTDVMSVSIGPVGGPYTVLGTYSDGNTAWGYYTVGYTIPTGLGSNYSLRFNSVSAAGGNPAIGNFLDAITVTLPSAATLSITPTHVNCFGGNTGAADAIVSNGTTPYTYTWTPTSAHTSSITGLVAGTYVLNVTEGNGCLLSGTVQITQGAPLTTTVSAQAVSCFGASNGTAQVTAFGSTGPYTYTWIPSGSSTSVATGLSAGAHVVQVSSAVGCTTSNTVVVPQGPSITLTVAAQPVSCPGASDGSAQATITGGLAPYTYTWTGSSITTSTVNALAQGVHTVFVTSSNGCTASKTFTINLGTGLSLSVSSQSTSCAGAADGTASVTVNNASGAYSYTWIPGAMNTAGVSNLAAGNYTAQVMSSAGCSASVTVTVNTGSSLNMSVASQSTSCSGAADGSATVTPNNGLAPFSYTWIPGGMNTAIATGLAAGNYTVQVVSSTGCTGTSTVDVMNGVSLSMSVSSQSPSCFGVADGTAGVLVQNGAGPYSYTWTPGAFNTASVTGLAAGNYIVQALSANGCPGSATIAVLQGAPLSLAVSSQSTSCLGVADGTAQVAVINNAGPFSYAWTPGGATTTTVTGLSASVYMVNVSSPAGCQGSATIAVNPGPALSLSLSSQNTTCFGAANGSATATVTTLPGSFSYSWTPGSLTGSTISGLAAGNYIVQASSVNGCSGSGTVAVANGPALNVSVAAQPVLCFGGADGSAIATVTNGAAPYSYTWTPSAATTPSVGGLMAANYSVQVLSAEGCTGNATVAVTQPLLLSSSIPSAGISCSGAATGSLQVSANGGTMPYTYNWMPGALATPTVTHLSAGTYSCNIEDANHCVRTVTAVVIAIPTGSAGVTNATACQGQPSVLRAYGASSYTWIPGNITGPTFSVAPSVTTSYTVIAKGITGCTDTLRTVVTINPKPFVFAGNDTIVNMDEPVTLTGTGSDTYGWIPLAGNPVLACNYCHELTENPQQNTCYVLEAVNNFYCWNWDTVCVKVTKDWGVYIPNAFTPGVDGVNDVFIPVGYGIEEIELFVFDRWGELIFHSDEEHRGWNGTYKNGLCKPDVYVYKAIITSMNHEEAYRVGSVTLLK